MKIGILINEFKGLSNWQMRIIKAILDDPSLELALVIKKGGNYKNVTNDSSLPFFSKFGLSWVLLALQIFIEKKVFFKEVFCVDKVFLHNALVKLPSITIGQRNSVEENVYETTKQVTEKNLDLLINLGFRNVPLNLINTAKHGIWDFLHADFSSTVTVPAGFSEVLQKRPTIGFTLLKHTNDKKVEIVDHASFNRGWSTVETAKIVQEGGVSVLLKNLKKLNAGYEFDLKTQNLQTYTNPKILHVVKYIFRFYINLLYKIKQKLAFKFWGRRHECWSIFIGKGSFLESTRSGIDSLKMPKDEFWADPFLFQYQGIDYVFFENFSYKKNRGKISCGEVKNQKLVEIVDVLDLDYHLSFPFIFEEDGAIFLMPETSENKRLEIYRAVDFPTKWELFTTAFEGEMVADAFFFDDEQNQKWLFLNKQAAETSPMNSELFIYKTDSIKLDNLQPHSQNPVIIDARIARNGGSIFRHNNSLYRPSQRNSDGIYGRALNINEIKKLTLEVYEEENVQIFEPDFDNNLMATHHLHQTENLFVFDAAYKSK